MSVLISAERIRFLLEKVELMPIGGINLNALGRIALEAIVARREVKKILEGEFPEEEKEEARKSLELIEALEESLRRLFSLVGVMPITVESLPEHETRRTERYLRRG